MKETTTDELEQYKSLTHSDVQEVQRELAQSPHLSSFLNKAWIEAVKGNIERMTTDLQIDNAAYHLFRIFRYKPELIKEMEDGLTIINSLARSSGRLDAFKQTPLRLPTESMDQVHQIDSGIFEVLILRALVRACASGGIKIEPFHPVGTSGSNIEARLWIDGRWCNIEATALADPRNLPGARGESAGSLNTDAMTASITYALEKKAANGRQLALVPPDESAIVFLAQKGFLSREIACSAANEFMVSRPEALSSVLIFSSPLCRDNPDLVLCPKVALALNSNEITFFERLNQFMGLGSP